MEKKMYDFSFEILKRMYDEGILKDIMLIGSWSVHFYREYFKSDSYPTAIRTTDMDFLAPVPFKADYKKDIFKIVEDLGFIQTISGSKGFIDIVHPDLKIEFLVPERGRGSEKLYPLPQLGVNAQPLRYLDFLIDNAIVLNVDGIKLRLPHPAAYGLHKFIIFGRRRNKDKKARDLESAIRVSNALIKKKKQKKVRNVFKSMHEKWRDTVIRNLEKAGEEEIIDILKG